MLEELFGEMAAATTGIIALEALFLGWLWSRSRRREDTQGLVAGAVRLGLRARRSMP